MKNDDTAPEGDDPTTQPVDDEPKMLFVCGIPRSVYLKNRGDK
jgi:hypothetical protein